MIEAVETTPSQDAELVQLRSVWEAAYRAEDPDALSQLWFQDGVLMPSGYPPIEGREAISESYRTLFSNYRVGEIEIAPVETKLLGNWALERGVIVSTLIPRTSTDSNGQSESQGPEERAAEEIVQSGDMDQYNRLDVGHYLAVLRYDGQDWRFDWFASNNTPEYIVNVLQDRESSTN